MAMYLSFTLFCVSACLARGAHKLQTVSENVTILNRYSRNQLPELVPTMKMLTSNTPNNSRNILPFRSSLKFTGFSAENISETSKKRENISDTAPTLPTEMKNSQLNIIKGIKGKNNVVHNFKQTEVKPTPTSVSSVSRSSPKNVIKTNTSLNTFPWKEFFHLHPDNITGDPPKRFTKPIKFERKRSHANDQTREIGLGKGMPFVSRIHRTGQTHNKPKAQTADGYDKSACSCIKTKCDCSNRYLSKIPQDLPTSITELFLNGNSFSVLPNNAFARYQRLENLVLYQNFIDTLEQGAFNGLQRLISLDLSNTQIISIPDRIFESLRSLKVILLDSNNMDDCSEEDISPFQNALAYLHSVEHLRIDYSGIYDFGPEYKNMTSLRALTVNCGICKMSLLKYTFQYLDTITTLNISSCKISGSTIAVGTFSPLARLQTLDVSHNPGIGMDNFQVILWNYRYSNLQTLVMSYIVSDYTITHVNKSITQLLPRSLTNLVARGNNIVSIDSDAVEHLPKSLRVIDISENNIIVNPQQLHLDNLVGLETLFVHSNDDRCLDYHDDYAVQSLCDNLDYPGTKDSMDVEWMDKKISVKQRDIQNTALPGKLRSVKINVQDTHYDFTQNIDQQNIIEVLDLSCSYIPQLCFCFLYRLPNLRCVNLRKSSMRQLGKPFADLPLMKVLILQSNNLNDFLTEDGRWFSLYVNLAYLDLSLNQLSFLRTNLLQGLDMLEYLRLDRNSFSEFGANISNMAHLKVLNLSNTELPQLPSETREHIDQLCKARPGQIRVDMADCPIQCDCFNLDFLKWMVSSPAFDRSFTGYKCRFSDTSIKYIVDGYQGTIRVLERECAKNFPMFLIVLAATSFLLCVVVGAIVYRLRWKIRYLYYAAYLKVMDKHKNDNQHEYVYDVFLSFDSEDQVFVTRLLSPVDKDPSPSMLSSILKRTVCVEIGPALELEKRGLKLLIHTRDFVAGTYIASNIVMAVAESRKTMVVLTRNLLESDWCNYELQMATMEAVHTGRQVLLFLLKENIPSRELDVDLLRHIRNNTYVPYPEPEDGDEEKMERFYDKLAHDLKC